MDTNFKEVVRIDTEALDLEWTGQAELFLEYSLALTKARHELDRLKEQHELLLAKTDFRVRKELSAMGTRVTEAMVTNTVTIDLDVVNASGKVLEKKYEVDVYLAIVKALEQRKDALENLVKLHGQSYFAGPQVPLEIGREYIKKKNEEIRSKISNLLKERS